MEEKLLQDGLRGVAAARVPLSDAAGVGKFRVPVLTEKQRAERRALNAQRRQLRTGMAAQGFLPKENAKTPKNDKSTARQASQPQSKVRRPLQDLTQNSPTQLLAQSALQDSFVQQEPTFNPFASTTSTPPSTGLSSYSDADRRSVASGGKIAITPPNNTKVIDGVAILDPDLLSVIAKFRHGIFSWKLFTKETNDLAWAHLAMMILGNQKVAFGANQADAAALSVDAKLVETQIGAERVMAVANVSLGMAQAEATYLSGLVEQLTDQKQILPAAQADATHPDRAHRQSLDNIHRRDFIGRLTDLLALQPNDHDAIQAEIAKPLKGPPEKPEETGGVYDIPADLQTNIASKLSKELSLNRGIVSHQGDGSGAKVVRHFLTKTELRSLRAQGPEGKHLAEAYDAQMQLFDSHAQRNPGGTAMMYYRERELLCSMGKRAEDVDNRDFARICYSRAEEFDQPIRNNWGNFMATIRQVGSTHRGMAAFCDQRDQLLSNIEESRNKSHIDIDKLGPDGKPEAENHVEQGNRNWLDEIEHDNLLLGMAISHAIAAYGGAPAANNLFADPSHTLGEGGKERVAKMAKEGAPINARLDRWRTGLSQFEFDRIVDKIEGKTLRPGVEQPFQNQAILESKKMAYVALKEFRRRSPPHQVEACELSRIWCKLHQSKEAIEKQVSDRVNSRQDLTPAAKQQHIQEETSAQYKQSQTNLHETIKKAMASRPNIDKTAMLRHVKQHTEEAIQLALPKEVRKWEQQHPNEQVSSQVQNQLTQKLRDDYKEHEQATFWQQPGLWAEKKKAATQRDGKLYNLMPRWLRPAFDHGISDIPLRPAGLHGDNEHNLPQSILTADAAPGDPTSQVPKPADLLEQPDVVEDLKHMGLAADDLDVDYSDPKVLKAYQDVIFDAQRGAQRGFNFKEYAPMVKFNKGVQDLSQYLTNMSQFTQGPAEQAAQTTSAIAEEIQQKVMAQVNQLYGSVSALVQRLNSAVNKPESF